VHDELLRESSKCCSVVRELSLKPVTSVVRPSNSCFVIALVQSAEAAAAAFVLGSSKFIIHRRRKSLSTKSHEKYALPFAASKCCCL